VPLRMPASLQFLMIISRGHASAREEKTPVPFSPLATQFSAEDLYPSGSI
jgi:hypothetical protein